MAPVTDWFTKYLHPPIARDVTMGGAVTEEQAINRAQYFDLVYSQSGTLYDLIPHAPRPTMDPSIPTTELPADGILGSVQTQTMEKYSKKKNQTTSPTIPPSKTASSPVASAEVNVVQSIESSSGKKKGKNKSKKRDNQQESNKPQNPDVDSKGKRKAKYHFLCRNYKALMA